MSITRRRFIQGTAVTAAALKLKGEEVVAGPKRKSLATRKRRTIYFNDARHYYLYVFEPPMKMEDAWRPVDEVAGTAVDTFIYGVASGGLFYPSKVGKRFKYEEHATAFRLAAFWRAWHNMQSLIDQGLDPLTVLIDRAHEKGMDFFASLRLGSYLGMDPAHQLKSGGRGFVHPEVRDHQFSVLEELAKDYPTEGVELDFAAPPGGAPFYFREEDVEAYTPVMTQWIRKVSEMVRNRPGKPGQVGARVYPTEAINLAKGLDVRTWLHEGFLDYAVPMVYAYNVTDANMPIDWLIEAAHEVGTSVYPMIQPYYRWGETAKHASPEMMRAAVANYWARGADGMYTWFLRWPLEDASRRILCELGDPDLIKEADKHYVISKTEGYAKAVGYQTPLPIEIAASDTGRPHRIPFYLADDIQAAKHIRLKINIYDLVTADQLTILLNGQSLADETCLRDYGHVNPYLSQWLEFHLKDVRPNQGKNVLEISLDHRAGGLISSLKVEDVEILVEYGSYPSVLRYVSPS